MIARNAYNSGGHFDPRLFFATRYNLHGTRAGVFIDVPEIKTNFDKGFKSLDLDTYELKEANAKWVLSDSVDDDPAEDYVYCVFLYSQTHPVLLELELNHDQISLIYLFDRSDKALEDWVLQELRNFRKCFGVTKMPEFRILSREKEEFKTSKVKIKHQAISIVDNYNDDFAPIDADIRAAIDEERSGLILLYGLPGTGKTSYIKQLVQDYRQTKFVFVPNDFVRELLHPAFITFIVKQVNTVLIIEDAEKVISNRQNLGEPSVVSTILQLTDGLFSDYLKMKVICTFNTDISKIDNALFRKGRMIASYEFGALKAEKVAQLKDVPVIEAKPMTLAEIYYAEDKSYAVEKRQIGF